MPASSTFVSGHSGTITVTLASLLIGVLVTTPLYAQSSAALQGQVFDASGALLEGATVRVRNESTGFDRSVATDDHGRYRVEEVPAQTYDVTASATGFKSVIVDSLTFA